MRVELSSGYGALQIKVADNGCGIDDAHVVKIFERGFTHGKERGTGVGLHVCKKIVEASGGVIDVISRKGKGTTFTVSIPLSVY